ncbi:hypothetical protein PR202_ga20816 [Eleusine coracana subsp. coracana]|uniref:DRBM domain-containing protein n=1 Tax=Eleusine coracana subsp. coracana TaxID=191504 RepID=A0AAV5CZ99_ELECO|nr:hypothetical protein PR202_ga20816 [Eleusine coracana subsp. coracana]
MFLQQGVVFCKTILHEFSVQTNTAWPSYSVARQDKPMTLFVASVVFDGSTYTGEAATSKKEAEQKAAYAAVKSILATANTVLTEIIRSKEILIKVFKSSQRIFTPIKFTRPAAYTEYGEQDHVAPESQDQSTLLMTVQEHKIVPVVDPSVNPSTKAATHSRKRKGRGSGDERVVKEH